MNVGCDIFAWFYGKQNDLVVTFVPIYCLITLRKCDGERVVVVTFVSVSPPDRYRWWHFDLVIGSMKGRTSIGGDVCYVVLLQKEKDIITWWWEDTTAGGEWGNPCTRINSRCTLCVPVSRDLTNNDEYNDDYELKKSLRWHFAAGAAMDLEYWWWRLFRAAIVRRRSWCVDMRLMN